MRHSTGEDGFVHFTDAEGGDYTLCGFSFDGEDGEFTEVTTRRRVDCPRCIAIVAACKSVKAREMKMESDDGL